MSITSNTPPKIYLGTPAIFHANALETIDEMQRLCALVGLEGIAPTIHSDLDLVKKTDGGIFCLDTFRRGTEMDTHMAIMLGSMAALGKPMAGWTRDERNYSQVVEDYFTTRNLTLSFADANRVDGSPDVKRDPDGMLVRPDAISAAQGAIEATGGQVFAHESWKKAFVDAARHISSTFGVTHEPIENLAIVATPSPA